MTDDAKPANVVDIHRQVSIEYLKSTSGFAIRTPRGQKDPGSVNWDPRTNSREKSNETIHTIQTTTDNLGVHLFGSVVDVDVDTDNPVLISALDYFLPPTNHVWGRASRPRTHRLYELSGANTAFLPSDFPFLAKIQPIESLSVEVRGGEQRSGRYSLLPGSIHPSGEAYEWADLKAARSTPVHVDLGRLMDGVRFACTAAIIVPYWVEGSRNELCKALCGFMYRAASYTDELDVGLTFDRDKALRLLEGVMHLADDDEHDRAMRLRTFEQTWDKADAGQPVVGATRIGEISGDKNIVPLLYALLAYTPDLVQLEEMFQKYVVIRNTTNIVDLDLGARGNFVMNKDAFVFTLSGQYITTPKGRVPVASVFINSSQRTIVDNIGIDPSKGKLFETHEGLKLANIWSGWGIEPANEEVKDIDVAPFLNYLDKVIACGDQKIYQWVLQWIADIFQNPAQKPGTALVLVGRQGSGKSFLFEKILRPIIGDAHFTKAGTTERLTSKFNAHMSGKLLIQGEEVVNSNRRADAEALKDAITSGRRTIEMKGRDSFEVLDHARYGFTSNHTDNAVNIGVGDRRFTIIKVNDEFAHYDNGKNKAKRDGFWGLAHEWCETRTEDGNIVPNQANLAKLHRYLLNVKIDKALIRTALDTQIKRATQQNSNRGMDAWLLSMIEYTNPFDMMREYDRGEGHSFAPDAKGNLKPTEGWPSFVPYTKLEQSIRQFTSKDYGEARSSQQIAKFFKDQGMISETEERWVRFAGKRVRVRPFPSRESIRDYLVEQGYEVFETRQEEPDAPESGPNF